MQSEQAHQKRFLGCSDRLLLPGCRNLKSWAPSTAFEEIKSEGNRGTVTH